MPAYSEDNHPSFDKENPKSSSAGKQNEDEAPQKAQKSVTGKRRALATVYYQNKTFDSEGPSQSGAKTPKGQRPRRRSSDAQLQEPLRRDPFVYLSPTAPSAPQTGVGYLPERGVHDQLIWTSNPPTTPEVFSPPLKERPEEQNKPMVDWAVKNQKLKALGCTANTGGQDISQTFLMGQLLRSSPPEFVESIGGMGSLPQAVATPVQHTSSSRRKTSGTHSPEDEDAPTPFPTFVKPRHFAGTTPPDIPIAEPLINNKELFEELPEARGIGSLNLKEEHSVYVDPFGASSETRPIKQRKRKKEKSEGKIRTSSRIKERTQKKFKADRSSWERSRKEEERVQRRYLETPSSLYMLGDPAPASDVNWFRDLVSQRRRKRRKRRIPVATL